MPLAWAERREPSYREHPSRSVILTSRVAPRLLDKLNHLSLSFTLYKRLMSPNFFRTTSPLFISQSLTQSPVAGFSLQLWSGGAENCLLSVPQSKQSELTGPDFKEATPQTHKPSVVTGKHTFRNHREDGGATRRVWSLRANWKSPGNDCNHLDVLFLSLFSHGSSLCPGWPGAEGRLRL